jgi:hypothetical protein
MAELLHCRHDGELSSHHSVQVTATAPIPTNNIMVLPGIYYNLGKTIILLMSLKRTISLLAWWQPDGKHIPGHIPRMRKFPLILPS